MSGDAGIVGEKLCHVLDIRDKPLRCFANAGIKIQSDIERTSRVKRRGRWQGSASAAGMRSSITVCKFDNACAFAIVSYGERRRIEAEIAEQIGVMGGSGVAANAGHARLD